MQNYKQLFLIISVYILHIYKVAEQGRAESFAVGYELEGGE